jgi:peptidase C39-like protein
MDLRRLGLVRAPPERRSGLGASEAVPRRGLAVRSFAGGGSIRALGVRIREPQPNVRCRRGTSSGDMPFAGGDCSWRCADNVIEMIPLLGSERSLLLPSLDPIDVAFEMRARDPVYRAALEARTVPQLTQMTGAFNQDYICGPTALAMIAAHYGRTLGLSPYALAQHIAYHAGTNPTMGTHPAMLGYVAGLLDLKVHPLAVWQIDKVASAIRSGAKVLALGNYLALPSHHPEPGLVVPHYIVISGLEGDRFVYNDPYSPGNVPRLLTPDQLSVYLNMAEATVLVISPGPSRRLRWTPRPRLITGPYGMRP